jgi:hypothetical protein
MSVIYSENATHRANLLKAEQTRQAAAVSGATQATLAAADIAYYRACIASAITNGCGTEPFVSALKGNHGLNA